MLQISVQVQNNITSFSSSSSIGTTTLGGVWPAK